ncbi:MAG: HAD-IA family hydrolase [Actinobacteria bacterium]|nr:HAD-IA family hydrolase [Actinomycetota bacterium]
MRFPTVLFDLDGTLIDSGAIILASFRHATRTVLQREIPDAQLLAAVGGSNLREQMRALDVARVEELVAAYRAHNEPLHEELQACSGVLDVVARLKDEGRKLGIVTAKRHETVGLAFAVLPLRELFDVVVGAEDTERHKPHPEPVLLALERLGVEASSAAYVGDSPFDIAAGRAAGVFAVGVTWGGIHTRARLEEEHPDAIVERAEELLGIL